jgi:NAD+ synthase (glutamine-hydrolysing)
MKKFSDAKCSFVYCNLVGGQDELIFDGNSMAFSSDMNMIAEGKNFEEDLIIVDMASKPIDNKDLDINNDIYNALSLGIKDYFSKTGHKKAVIGLSGGIDSALVACLAVDALGSDNVYLISMPSRFSSEHSKTDAKNLAYNLNAHFDTIDIDSLFEKYLEVLSPKFKGLESNVAEENIQSRIRGNILMAISNKFGCLVLSTGNKTELALGYCTLYGDMSGGLSAIGDLSKTEVYNLAKWKNKTSNNIIPESSITKPPSAELAPNQVDPFDYDLISPIVDKIVLGEDVSKDISRNSGLDDIALRINRNEHKRRQAAPVLRISKKAFGMGRRIPIVNHFDE